MRVLLCLDQMDGGGSHRAVDNLAQLLQAQGHQIIILTTRFNPQLALKDVHYRGQGLWWFHEARFKLTNWVIKAQRLQLGWSLLWLQKVMYLLWSITQDKLYSFELKRTIESEFPDLVHFHSFVSGSAFTLPRRYYLPSVLTVHHPWIVCPSELLAQGGRTMCNQLCTQDKVPGTSCLTYQCISNPLLRSIKRRRFQRLYQERHLGFIDRITAPSNVLVKAIQDANHIKPFQLQLCPNPLQPDIYEKLIDLSALHPIPAVLTQQPYFLALGHWSENKGFMFLMKAFRQLPHVPLVVVGSGPDKAKMQRYINDHGLTHITLLDWQSDTALSHLYKHAYGVILPSLWFENAPMVIAESFAYAKPVIGATVGGVPEWVISGKTGYLFERGKMNSLRSAVASLWNHPAQAQAMGHNAYLWLKERASAQAHTDQWLSVYEQALTHQTVTNPRQRRGNEVAEPVDALPTSPIGLSAMTSRLRPSHHFSSLL